MAKINSIQLKDEAIRQLRILKTLLNFKTYDELVLWLIDMVQIDFEHQAVRVKALKLVPVEKSITLEGLGVAKNYEIPVTTHQGHQAVGEQ